MPSSVTCTQCRAIIPAPLLEVPDWFACASCGSQLYVNAFPALIRPTSAASRPENSLIEGESTCFFHPAKKAVVPCDSCGRFLCALCDLEMDHGHLCPACLETGRTKGKLEKLIDRRFLPGDIALLLAVVPLLFIWTSIVGAPAALFVVIRYWKAPAGMTTRHPKAKLLLAGFLAVAEIVGWIIGAILLASH